MKDPLERRSTAPGHQPPCRCTPPDHWFTLLCVRNAEFNDPALVEVYDAQCPWGAPDDLFLALANETPRSRVLDLGCGTGRLTLALAGAGHAVTGLDPAQASLDAAKAKRGAERVTWIRGTAESLPGGAFDLALMTGHVAQFFVDDALWAATLADLRRSLVPGGRLIFDARDPAARGWEKWNPQDSWERVALAHGRGAEVWTEVTEMRGEVVTFVSHYNFSDRPEEKLTLSSLRFRPEAALRSSLAAAGFGLEQLYGGWQRQAVGQGDGELIVVARAR